MKNSITTLVLVFLITISCNETNKSSSDEVLYEVFFREKLAGEYKKISIGDHSFKYNYSYTDRGRGPEYSEDITLNNQNYIISQSIKGFNYRKVPVNEVFSIKGSLASWDNPKEKKTAEIKENELYFRYDGSPGIYEILAQNLISSETGKVKLVPEGEAELVNKTQITLSNGAVLDLIMIKGLDINPTYLWIKDGQLICSIVGNLHVVHQEFRAMRSEMKKLQDDAEDNYLMNISKKLSHSINKVVIQNVNVYCVDSSLLLKQDVFIENETILSISPTGSKIIPEKAKVINGTGKTLMPGMYDMHTHNSKFRGILHIAGGITSVRDLANNKQLKDLSSQFNENEIIGPRIVTFAGIIDGPGPFANQRNVITNLEEGIKEIQVYKNLGYHQIKLYSSIKPEWVEPMAKKAHDLGMRVSGHIPAYMTATQAINKGYNEIQHINMVFLNFLSDTIDTRSPLRFTMPAQHGADLDLKSDEYLNFVKLLKDKNIVIDPTVSIFEDMFVSQKGKVSPTYVKIANRLPVINQRKFYSGGLPKSGKKIKRYADSHSKMLNVINDLYNKGVVIVPGTDGLPGFLYHRELELYVKSGISTKEVLKLATIKSAELTGTSKMYGSVEVGKKADLILIDGNPIENISNIRNVEWTMKEGTLFYAKELYKSIGIKHFK